MEKKRKKNKKLSAKLFIRLGLKKVKKITKIAKPGTVLYRLIFPKAIYHLKIVNIYKSFGGELK